MTIWRLAECQHGVVSQRQLLELGLTRSGIRHRRVQGRLHELLPGVYAVGRPEVSKDGRLLAAVLSSGAGAVLSHLSAAELWGIRAGAARRPEVSVAASRFPRSRGVRVHRRAVLPPAEQTRRRRIPVTSPALTIVDIAPRLSTPGLEAAINEADVLGLINPDQLREWLERMPRMRGLGVVRRCLDRHSVLLTDSELERRFLRLIRAAGLPLPLTGRQLNGFKVDFFWPALGLVVEADGLRYHRTAAEQARDRRRDQAHARAGLTQLRFTHAQAAHEPGEVASTLAEVIARLTSSTVPGRIS